MKKIFFDLTLILSLVLLFSCNKGKIAEYEKTIDTLNSKIALLQEEIDIYKMTDQYYYQSGADEFLNQNYWQALSWMGKLKVKFPTSPLIVYADKIIEDTKLQIEKLPSRYTIFRGLDKSKYQQVKNYYIPGVGDIPQKLEYDEDFEVADPSRLQPSEGGGIIMPGTN
jgi:hypothetical protein